MLAAVELDGEVGGRAVKIHDIRTDRVLTSKFESVEVPILKEIPELGFGVGLIMAKVSAAFGRGAMPSHLGNYGGPSPNLSHCGGRGIVLALLLLTLTPAVAFGQASAPGSAPASPGQAAATSPSPAQAPGAAQP